MIKVMSLDFFGACEQSLCRLHVSYSCIVVIIVSSRIILTAGSLVIMAIK